MKTILSATERPTQSELVDDLLDRLRARREALFKAFVAECKEDPAYLDRALKTLRPLRGRGRSIATPGARRAVVDGIMTALQGERPGDIVEAIAVTLKLSTPQARRLYDAALKRLK